MDLKRQQQQQRDLATNKRIVRRRRTLQVLFTIFIFSSIFFYFRSPFLLRFLCSISEFITRRAMFLFCNMILLFLSRDSISFSPSSSTIDSYDEFLISKEDRLRSTDAFRFKENVSFERVLNYLDEEEEKEVVVEEKEETAAEEEFEDEGEGGEEEFEDAYEKVEEEAEEERMNIVVVDEMEHWGVEELNKRCEEFIERVKRDRKLEAMQFVMIS